MYTTKTAAARLKKVSIYSISAIVALAGVLFAFKPADANAATLGQVFVRFDHLGTSAPSTGTVCAKPTTALTEASVQVTFPTGYTLSSTLANWAVSTTNLAWPTGGTLWPGIGTATNVTSQTVTFPSTDLTVGTLYCFNWTSTLAVSIKSSATANNTGTVTTRDGTTATIDTATFSTASIGTDQIGVSATVPQTFSFALANTTDNLGTLTTSSVNVSPTPATATVNTNAAAGWVVWAKDLNAGLKSTAANYTIPSATGTLNTSTEGHNFGVTSAQTGGTGVISLPAAFDGAVAFHGGGLTTALQQVASSTGTANGAVLTLKNNVGILSTTAAAADYADTITVVGAGLF